MPKVRVTSGPGFLGRLVRFPLLTPAPGVRNLAESSWRVPDEHATLGVSEIQPIRMASSIAEDLDYRAEPLDAVAGSSSSTIESGYENDHARSMLDFNRPLQVLVQALDRVGSVVRNGFQSAVDVTTSSSAAG
jgi:hypothetical protein